MTYRRSIMLGTLLFAAPNLASAHDGPDGTISHRRNEVRTQPQAETDWRDAEVGDLIYKQGRVNTLEASTAAVVFREDGTVALRENTLLIVYGHHALRNKKIIATEAELERGALRARLGELEGEDGAAEGSATSSQAQVATPGAEANLEGGNSLVKVDDAGTSRIHNHGDGKTKVKSKRGGQVDVKRGMGVKVEKSKRAAKPIPLPPTPAWAQGPQVFLGVAGRISVIRGGWGRVDAAQSYYVEVASDAEGIDVMSATTVPNSITGFEVHGLPVGRYSVRVASVDDDQFESIPSDGRDVEIVDVTLIGPGGVGPVWPEDGGLTPTPMMLPGTRLGLPDNIRCGTSAETLEAAPLLVEPGVHALYCERDDGVVVNSFPIEVPSLPALAASEDPDGAPISAASLELDRGRQVTRSLVLDTTLELPRELHVSSVEGIAVDAVTPGDRPGTWRVTMTAAADAPADAELRLSFVGPGETEVDTTFATVAVTVVEAPVEVEPEPALRPERHMFEFGVAGGLLVLNPSHGLYKPSEASHQPFERPSGEFVVRAGYYPIRWVGVELDGRVAPARVESDDRATVYSVRAQAIGQLPYRVTPFVVVGGELLGVSSQPVALGSDADFGAHVGGGVKAYLTSKIALRLGVAAMLHEGLGDSRSAHFEADLGISVVLGRRSAGRKR